MSRPKASTGKAGRGRQSLPKKVITVLVGAIMAAMLAAPGTVYADENTTTLIYNLNEQGKGTAARNGGVESEEVVYNTLIKDAAYYTDDPLAAEAPTLSGYHFEGWYLDPEGTIPVGDTPISGADVPKTALAKKVDATPAGGTFTDSGIVWRVLAKDGDKVFIISDKTLLDMQYSSSSSGIVWSQSKLRAYLNGEFYNSLSDDMKLLLEEQTLTTRITPYKKDSKVTLTDNSLTNPSAYETTVDKVFVLSAEEAFYNGRDNVSIDDGHNNSKYISSDYASARVNGNTVLFSSGAARAATNLAGKSACINYWLRNACPGYTTKVSAIDDSAGHYEDETVTGKEGVRPTIVLNVSKGTGAQIYAKWGEGELVTLHYDTNEGDKGTAERNDGVESEVVISGTYIKDAPHYSDDPASALAPTLFGYDFLGWYLDPEGTTPVGDTKVPGPTVIPTPEPETKSELAKKVEATPAGGTFTDSGILWRVLAKDGDKVFIISDKTLLDMQYSSSSSGIVWSQSKLRAYLNGEFYNSLSTDMKNLLEEQTLTTRIKPYKKDSKVTLTDNSLTNPSAYETTVDKVFVLSAEEAFYNGRDNVSIDDGHNNSKYISSDYASARVNGNTVLFSSGAARATTNLAGKSACINYWLRNACPGYTTKVSAIDDSAGHYEDETVTGKEGVRPTIVLNLNQGGSGGGGGGGGGGTVEPFDPNITIYAAWAAKTDVQLLFDANGGTAGTVTSKTLTFGSTVGELPTAAPEAPTRDGYVLLGWATTAEATTPDFTSAAVVDWYPDKTVYAVWERGDDGEGPILEVPSPHEVEKTAAHTEYDPMSYGVNALDDTGEDLTDQIVVTRLDGTPYADEPIYTDEVGIYALHYEVDGSDGYSTEAYRVVVVNDGRYVVDKDYVLEAVDFTKHYRETTGDPAEVAGPDYANVHAWDITDPEDIKETDWILLSQSGYTWAPGAYIFNYAVEEKPSVRKSIIATLTGELDTAPPTLTVPSPIEVVYIDTEGNLVGEGFDPILGTLTAGGADKTTADNATAIDDVYGDVTDDIETTGSVNVTEAGIYVVHYTVTDREGNTSQADRVVIVNDGTIAWNEEYAIQAHDFTHPFDASYVSGDPDETLGEDFADVKAWDISDPANIVRTDAEVADSGGYHKYPDVYNITYAVEDVDDSPTITITGTLTGVWDVIPPTLDVPTPIVVDRTQSEGYDPIDGVLTSTGDDKTDDDDVSANDNVDGDITDEVEWEGVVDLAVPGFYPVHYTVSDDAGNTSEADRLVVVNDGRYVVDPEYILEAVDFTKPYDDPSVSGDVQETFGPTFANVHAWDIADYYDIKEVDAGLENPGGYTNEPATYYITYNVVDKPSVHKTIVGTLTGIHDVTPPELTIPSPINLPINTPFDPITGVAGNDADNATAWDDVDNDVTGRIVCTDDGGLDVTEDGVYILSYEVTDLSGNKSTGIRVVLVNDGTYTMDKDIIHAEYAVAAVGELPETQADRKTFAIERCEAKAWDGETGLPRNGINFTGTISDKATTYTIQFSITDSHTGKVVRRTVNLWVYENDALAYKEAAGKDYYILANNPTISVAQANALVGNESALLLALDARGPSVTPTGVLSSGDVQVKSSELPTSGTVDPGVYEIVLVNKPEVSGNSLTVYLTVE